MTTENFWNEHIDTWAIHALATRSSPQTVYSRKQHLTNLAKAFPCSPWEIEPVPLMRWFAGKKWAKETRRGRRQTFILFWDWGISYGLTDKNPALLLPRVAAALPCPRPAPDDAIFLARTGAKPHVDLMLRLAAELGLRRAEVAQIHTDDVIQTLSGWDLRVHGKGSKERLIPLPVDLAQSLLEQDKGKGFIFPGRDQGHLSPRWVGKLVSRALPGAWTMHTLRHRCATIAYSLERDVFVVQELLGHASPATTRRYVQIPRDSLRKTVSAMIGSSLPQYRLQASAREDSSKGT